MCSEALPWQCHRRIIADASRWLAAGATLLIETSARQADTTLALLGAAGFAARSVYSDEHEATVAIGVRN